MVNLDLVAVTVLVPVDKSLNDFDDVGARIALATVKKQMEKVLFSSRK